MNRDRFRQKVEFLLALADVKIGGDREIRGCPPLL